MMQITHCRIYFVPSWGTRENMDKFIAIRVHEGYMTADEVPSKMLKGVKKAYKELYGEEMK